ncbi:unnamed protein product [Vitrella brassicaformis CCMP3155]|uniref:RING-type domain-containing protein n=1 Tax=Vitrella brassicaformis (strain CCMP3155) TaxID=1169540 RepID=A0A0G4GFA9_VITBC|nr:unnamed protein product [Vitrella brassicaformis CCMP3155]|eukprot:CEM28177.1 unnamed protein product [Vitrella brassicaformis CCMP3155]
MEGAEDVPAASSASAQSGVMDTAAVQSTSKAQRKRAKKAKKRGAALDASQDGREADEAAPPIAADKPPVETRADAAIKSLQPDKDVPLLGGLLADAPRTSSLLKSSDATCPLSIEAIFSGVRAVLADTCGFIPSYQLRWTLCDRVYEAIDPATLREAGRNGKLDVCVRAVRAAAEQLASEAHLQRVLSVKMWTFLVTLIEDIADQLEGGCSSFAQAIRSMWATELSTQPTRPSSTTATWLPIFPPAIDPVQLVLQHSPSPHHRLSEARLLPPDGLMRLLELFRLDKGRIDTRGSYTWDMSVDEYVAADCALGEGEGHKRAGSFTVSGASGSLAVLNGSYVIRPTAEEQARLVAPPDGALAYVGERVVFERLLCPTDETTTADHTRGVWVAYEPATEARLTPRLLAIGPGRSDIPLASVAAHPAVSSPAFETDQWYTVDDRAQLVKIGPFQITAALPLDFCNCRSRFDPTTLELVWAMFPCSSAPMGFTAISDYVGSLAEGSDALPVAYYVSPTVMENLPPTAHNPEPLFADLPTSQPVPVSKRPLLVRDGEANVRRWGLMRLSDDWASRRFTQWPFNALALLLGNGGLVGEPFKGGPVAVVRSELTSSTTCTGGCSAQPDVGRPAGDMPLVHVLSAETAEQDLAYLSTEGVWTHLGPSGLICSKCCTGKIRSMAKPLPGAGAQAAGRAEGDDDASSAEASGAGDATGLTTRPNTRQENTPTHVTRSAEISTVLYPQWHCYVFRDDAVRSVPDVRLWHPAGHLSRQRICSHALNPIATQRQQPDTGQADTGPAASSASEAGPVPAKDISTAMPPSMPPQHTGQDETTRCQASTPAAGGDPVGMNEDSTGTPQAASAVVGASGSVSIGSAFGSTHYVGDRLAREGPWECGVDLRAVFEGLAQKLTDTAFGPLFRLRRIVVRQVLECVQLDQLSEALSKAGSNRPMEEAAASLHKEAGLIAGDGKHQTLCSRYLWNTIVLVLKAIAVEMEGDGVAFVKAMQDIRRRVQEQDASNTADVTLPPLPAAGDNFYDFARLVVAALTQQGPPDNTYLETHLQTLLDAVAADPLLDLLFFFRLDQGPPKSPTQDGTEGESAWHATFRGYFDQCRTVAPTGGRRHGSFTVSGDYTGLNGTYLLRPTEEEQRTVLGTYPEDIVYVGEKMAFERLVYPQADGNVGGLWIACAPETDRTISPLRAFAFGPFKDDSVSNRNPLLSHPAAANPALETNEWFAVDQEGRISRLEGVKITTTLPLSFDIPRSVLRCKSKVERIYAVGVHWWADTAEPLACESLDDYYTHYLAEREVSKGAVFPMAFYLDAQVMQRLPPSVRHKERLTTSRAQSAVRVACVSHAETSAIEMRKIRLADEYVTKAFTEWPPAAVLALLATGSAESRSTGGLVYVLRAESRAQTCCRCGKPCAGSSEGLVDTIPLVHTLTHDDLMGDDMIEKQRRYIREAPAGLCVQSATGSLMCGPCALDRVESAYPTRPDRTPVDVLATFSSLLSLPSDTQTVPSPQPKSVSSSSTPSRNSPATSSIFRGIFTDKDKTKPKPKPAPTTPKPKPKATQPSTPPSTTRTVTVESIHEAFPDIATVTSGTEGDKQPSSETLAIVRAFLQHNRGQGESGGLGCVESSECDGAQARETFLRAVKKFFMDHRTALQSDPSAVFALGPLRHVRGEWLPQWHTAFVSELSKGQQLMQKELGAATTRGPHDTDSSAVSVSPPDAATRTDTPTRAKAIAHTQDESTTPTAGEPDPDESQAEIDKLTDKCARLERELAAAHEKLKTAEDGHTKEKDGLNGTIKRLQDDVKRLTSESAASKKMAEKERKAADAQRSTLEDILKDKDKQIKQTQKTADDRVRRVSQQVRQEADKAAKTQTDTVTKQHREELDALRGEHRSAILELSAQHRMAIEQRETEVRGEAERALANMTRERDQLRQRLREERLRSARVEQEKDVELRRLREAEAPLRREILTLKQQLSSAQPPHSRVSAGDVSSLDLPSVRQLLDDLASEQHRLTQLHQAAIEREIQLRHQQQPNRTSPSSSSSTAAAVPTHTAAPSMPPSLSMDGINGSPPPPPPVSGSSSSAQANGPCAAPSSSSSGGGGVGSSVSKCQLCLENPPDIILLPCGHKVVCQECFEKWMAPMPTEDKLCPEHTCRQPYSEVRYIFGE